MTEQYAMHADFCGWHEDQSASACTCGTAGRTPKGQRDPNGYIWGCGHDCRDWDCDGCKVVGYPPSAATDDGHAYSNGSAGRAGNWMQTFSGRQFWPIDPRADEVEIEDIAHALAHACRFAGHCEAFYSVAEHSVLVSQIVPPEHALVALLHDASEAYVVDIPRPLKPYLSGYKEIETRVWHAIADRFGLPHEIPTSVKDADNAVLLAEADQIMKPHPAPWSVPGVAAEVVINCYSPRTARYGFLRRFRELIR